MKNLMRGIPLTLRSMGFKIVFREILRRISGREYHYRGIPVNTDTNFRLIRNLLLKGYDIYRSGDEVCVHTYFGDFCVDVADLDLLGVLDESLEEMYGFINVKDAIIVDIGAYIGETALLFLSKGASKIYALEPVDKHYHYMLRNIYRNKAVNRVIALNYGAWYRETLLTVDYETTGTGMHTSSEKLIAIKVKSLGGILKEIYRREGRIDLVKMDCEGCEYSLLNLSAEDLKLASQYIIEIHGVETPIIDKMSESGFKHRFVREVASLVTVHHFTLHMNTD
ncbi:MAG: FkbM family methyltransferase [Sulfolobales archaeon]